MITTTGRFPEEPLPRLGSEVAEAPEFPVTFSRPSDMVGRSDARPNSFRWAGSGTIRVLERGLLVLAKRRSALAFYTTEQRLVPAWEIADVYREGSCVRLELRGDRRHRHFFQFWAGDASTAGTIVRLLPTTRTIEYEGPPPDSSPEPGTSAHRRRRLFQTDTLIPLALAIVLMGIIALLTTPKLREYISPTGHAHPRSITESGREAASRVPRTPMAHHPTDAEVMNARMLLSRFDDRIDGLRAQFRIAFTALQYGDLSKQDFIDGANRWLIPQWRTLYKDLGTDMRPEEELHTAVRKHLMALALGWEGALHEYARGLQEDNSAVVLNAIDQMSVANDERRRAWDLIDHPAHP
jgi:hypothetical protein